MNFHTPDNKRTPAVTIHTEPEIDIKNNPLPKCVEAILFDMDDTLVDSEYAWAAATRALWSQAGKSHSAPLIPGASIADLVDAYAHDYPQADKNKTAQHLLDLLKAALGHEVVAMPGACALLKRLDSRIPLAVASNSPTDIVHKTIAALGWSEKFVATLGTNDVSSPKPAPDLYLEAARRCGANPKNCIVFEDSPLGARAGMTAGAFVVTINLPNVGHAQVRSLLDPIITTWNPKACS